MKGTDNLDARAATLWTSHWMSLAVSLAGVFTVDDFRLEPLATHLTQENLDDHCRSLHYTNGRKGEDGYPEKPTPP